MGTGDGVGAACRAWVDENLGVGPFAPLDDADLDALTAIMRLRTVDAGQVLFTRHDDLQYVYVLERGSVALARPNLDRTSFLNLLEPGDVFGDVGQLIGRRAPVDAIVLVESTVLEIEGGALLRLLADRPRLAMRWMASLATRLADAQDRLEELLAGPLDFQVASMLLHLADDEDTVHVSQQVMAQLLGSRRPSVARSLANLERRGFVDKHYRRIRVLDRAGLRALIGDQS